MKEEDDELKKREDGSTNPKSKGASNGTQQAGKTLKNISKMDSSFELDHVLVHSGMLDGLDEVEGGVVDLKGDHVPVDPGRIWKFGSQLLGKEVVKKNKI